jgi:tetratricopeptide (TPR) repeat protein
MIYESLLLALGIASTQVGASSQPAAMCQLGDAVCFTKNHENFCSSQTATIESCNEWIRILEGNSRLGRPELLLRTGEAYEALARITSNPTEAERYRNHAIKIYRDLLRRNSSNAQAMLALAVATEDRSERIKLLRRGIELAPNEIYAMQLLASELLLSGGSEETLEAARVMEKAYAKQSGPNKLYLASKTYDLYMTAGSTKEASEFKKRVIDSLGLGELKALPADADPETVSSALMASCDRFVVPLVGSQKCMQDLELVVKQLVSSGNFVKPKELASVAAATMAELSQAESELGAEFPNWMQTFLNWLETLRKKGYETADVYSAIAKFTSGDERLNALKRAKALDPKNAQVSLRLGMEFAQREMWNEAVQEFTRAKGLMPPEQRAAVDYDLEVARKKLSEKASAPTP